MPKAKVVKKPEVISEEPKEVLEEVVEVKEPEVVTINVCGAIVKGIVQDGRLCTAEGVTYSL